MNKAFSPFLKLDGISRHLPTFSLKDVSFSLEEGDYFILLGVSGAGKSLVLETIAGLVLPETGSVWLKGKDITFEKIQKRKVGLVFQDHAVFPHLSVMENIRYALHGKDLPGNNKKLAVEEIAEQLGIGELLHRRPATLSGGELQRVALARTLIQKPDILLLDEPLSSLDTRLKSGLRSLLRQLNRQGQTIIHVTHDYEEALALGNSIAVMHEGRILQVGDPFKVFSSPSSEFVAHFTGARNFFKASLESNGEYARISEGISIKLPGPGNPSSGYILIRSEEIFLSNSAVETSATNNFRGTILEIIPSRSGFEIVIDIGVILHSLITRESLEFLGLVEGKEVFMHFKASAVKFIPT